ncbi:MAG: beta-ketoacyl synthase chain length factor [Herbaspirillum sp.]|nr:beta-ketoacyl synthase chain length factor [Herbaspirillum sp.]
MFFGDVSFSVVSHAAWVPGIESPQAWQQWIDGNAEAAGSGEPAVKSMPPMLRRRTSAVGKLALETAYAAISSEHALSVAADDIPTVFASRHGECARSVELLQALAAATPLSPAAFSLSVHNANAGLFSIARGMHGNSMAISAGQSTVEHAVIEACGLLADGAPYVLLVVADAPLPELFTPYSDCREHACGWSWLMQAADEQAARPSLSLQWDDTTDPSAPAIDQPAGAAAVLRFFLDKRCNGMVRHADGRRWHWMRHD